MTAAKGLEGTAVKGPIDALAESISEPGRPPHWLYTLAADQRNLDLLPGLVWVDAEKGCVHCKGAFVEIDQFGVERPPLIAACVYEGGPLQVASDEPMPVVAVKLLCSLGHTTVVDRAAWGDWVLPALGVGLAAFLLFSKAGKNMKRVESPSRAPTKGA